MKENHVSIEEDNLSEKTDLVEEKIGSINRDEIVNLADLLKLMLINDECGNRKVVVDSGELIGNINQKKKSVVLEACRCPLYDQCYRWGYFFNIHLEYCGSVR